MNRANIEKVNELDRKIRDIDYFLEDWTDVMSLHSGMKNIYIYGEDVNKIRKILGDRKQKYEEELENVN